MPNYDSAYTGAEIDAAVSAVQAAVAADGIVNTDGLDTILGNYLTQSSAANTYLAQSDAASTYQPIIAAGTTGQFYRGDKTWTNQLSNHIFNTTDIAEGAANLSTQATARKMTFYRNGITIPYQMDNANDGGMIRVRGASESTTVFELGTWDDSGSGETIQFNYYPTTSQITPTYSVSVPKETGIIFLRRPWWTSGNGNNSNDLRHGCVFAYTNHNCPTNGTLVAFDCSSNEAYTLQLQGAYGGGGLYYRNRNGDNGNWGSWYSISASAVSSIKTKTNIKNLTDNEARKILSLRPISFDYKEEYGKKNQYGFIAEEVDEVLPYMISNYQWDNTEMLTNEILQLDFYRIIPHMVKLIQIQNQEIENLKSRIDSLENK